MPMSPNDVFGQAYEYLIKRFADPTNKKAGEYYTPRAIVKLMVSILDPQEGETVYDPACGTGGMLIEAWSSPRAQAEKTQLLWESCSARRKPHHVRDRPHELASSTGHRGLQDRTGDTLRDPRSSRGDRLATFDCVIANPPFSLELGGDAGRATPGAAISRARHRKDGDWAWVQHMITSMAPNTGRVAVVLPHGALFRGGPKARSARSCSTWTSSKPSSVWPEPVLRHRLAACVLVAAAGRT